MEVIFDGEDVEVSFRLLSNDSVVFSFSGFRALQTASPKYGEGFLAKCGLSAVFFVAKKDHWWQTPEMPRAIEAALIATQGIRNRYTYGQSMGGFGAVMFAKRLNSRYLATAPQLTVDSAKAPLHPVWAECIGRWRILEDDIRKQAEGATGIIIFDPRDKADRSHAELLEGVAGNHHRLIVPFATHYIPRAVSEMGLLARITSEVFSGTIDLPEARRDIRKARLHSTSYLSQIVRMTKRRRSSGLFERLYRHIFSYVETGKAGFVNSHHIANFIAANAREVQWPVPAERLLGISSFRPAFQLESLPGCQGSYISVGNDPSFIVVTDGSQRFSINWYSSSEGRAEIFWTSKKNGQGKFQKDLARSFPVLVGTNSLIMDLDGLDADPVLRFDPLDREGVVLIRSAECRHSTQGAKQPHI